MSQNQSITEKIHDLPLGETSETIGGGHITAETMKPDNDVAATHGTPLDSMNETDAADAA